MSTHTPQKTAEAASFPVPLIHVSETDSTNRLMHQLCDGGNHPEEFTTIVADYQTAGRGQRGNSWESEAGKNLLFSFILYPTTVHVRQQFLISQLVALAIQEELSTYTDHVSIKWPNDIYREEKKICGMLIENDLMGNFIGQSIVGVGLNLNQKTFHSSAPNPVSLSQITGQTYDIMKVAGRIMTRICTGYKRLTDGDTAYLAKKYQDALFRKSGIHPYKDAQGTFNARIAGVEPTGQLILKDEEGHERRYMFKEVEYVL